MKSQVLSIEQMKELEALGIDTSNASMFWRKLESFQNPILQVMEEYYKCKNGFHSDVLCPTFILQDILEMLPKIHLHHNIYAMNKDVRWEISIENESRIQHKEFSESLLKAAFNMLKWCKQSNYI